MEEKKTSEIPPSCQQSSELEKRLDPEKAVEEAPEAGQVEPSAPQEGPMARAEVVFLHDMVRWNLCRSNQ